MSTVEVSDLQSLWNRGGELLDACASILAATPAGCPQLRYQDCHPPVFDCCPALIVSNRTLGVDFTGGVSRTDSGHAAVYQRSNLTGFSVWAIRCAAVPKQDGQPPPIARKEEVANMTTVDLWAIWNGILRDIADDALWGGRCTEIYFGQAIPVEPQGGCVGWQIPLSANLGGIPFE